MQTIGLIGLYFMVLFIAIYGLEKMRVPPILGFLLLGLLSQYITPLPLAPVFPIINEVAVWLLFFFIGLEYSPEALTRMGRHLWRPGLIDFMGNFTIPLGLFSLTGYPLKESLLLSAAFYPSSTVIVAKLLADTRRLASSEAELLIGILIFEDVVGILLLAFLGGLGSKSFTLYEGLYLLGSFLIVMGIFFLLSRWGLHIVEKILTPLANHELVVFFVVGLVIAVGALGHEMGLSGALLAFLLGVLIPKEHPFFETTTRTLAPFKELAVGLFFFSIPSTLDLSQVPFGSLLWMAPMSLVLKGVSTYLGAMSYGLGPRGRYRAALSFLPKGEFSLLFAQIERQFSALIVGLVLLTSAIGTPIFLQAERISTWLVPRKATRTMVRQIA